MSNQYKVSRRPDLFVVAALLLGFLLGVGGAHARATARVTAIEDKISIPWAEHVLHYEAMLLVDCWQIRSESAGINVDAGKLRAWQSNRRWYHDSWEHSGGLNHSARTKSGDELERAWLYCLRLEIAYRRDQALRKGANPDKLLLEIKQLEDLLGALPDSSAPWWERSRQLQKAY